MRENIIKRKSFVMILLLACLQVVVAAPAFAAWNDWRSSYATYTETGFSGGAAMLDPIDPAMEITALNPTDYNYNGVKAALAGAYLEVKGPKGTTVVYVNDLYAGGAPGALDLCPKSFAKIGKMEDGKINIQWHVVKAPVKGNIAYKIKEGSSQWWAAIQVRNHKYPVVKMEYYRNGQWVNMEKTNWNHFIGNSMGTNPIKVRITDIRGTVVTDTLPALSNGAPTDYIVPGHVQLPD